MNIDSTVRFCVRCCHRLQFCTCTHDTPRARVDELTGGAPARGPLPAWDGRDPLAWDGRDHRSRKNESRYASSRQSRHRRRRSIPLSRLLPCSPPDNTSREDGDTMDSYCCWWSVTNDTANALGLRPEVDCGATTGASSVRHRLLHDHAVGSPRRTKHRCRQSPFTLRMGPSVSGS